MITNKINLKLTIEIEKKIYLKLGYRNNLKTKITNSEIGYIYSYIKLLRYDEYYENCKKSIISKIIQGFIRRKRNKLGLKLGMNIPVNTCDEGLTIYHSNGIIINAKAKIGKNCKLHGDNCIGNDGIHDDDLPILGDNVDVGIGAKIIGKVEIRDNVSIGANAVVLKGKYDADSIIVGIPAKIIKRRIINGKS